VSIVAFTKYKVSGIDNFLTPISAQRRPMTTPKHTQEFKSRTAAVSFERICASLSTTTNLATITVGDTCVIVMRASIREKARILGVNHVSGRFFLPDHSEKYPIVTKNKWVELDSICGSPCTDWVFVACDAKAAGVKESVLEGYIDWFRRIDAVEMDMVDVVIEQY
jgi:hypothetical protein